MNLIAFARIYCPSLYVHICIRETHVEYLILLTLQSNVNRN